jgi:adenylate kinase family enzyme
MEGTGIARRGLMLVLSSPSGAGKTTIARKLLEKASDIEISRTGIELKTVIDQLREQVQNIE